MLIIILLREQWLCLLKTNKKERERRHRNKPMMTLPFCVIKSRKTDLFPRREDADRLQGKTYCPHLKKPTQRIYSSIFNPYLYTFSSGGTGNGDRQAGSPGNSACMGEHSPCRPCYTAACHSRSERKTIPAAISYSCS